MSVRTASGSASASASQKAHSLTSPQKHKRKYAGVERGSPRKKKKQQGQTDGDVQPAVADTADGSVKKIKKQPKAKAQEQTPEVPETPVSSTTDPGAQRAEAGEVGDEDLSQTASMLVDGSNENTHTLPDPEISDLLQSMEPSSFYTTRVSLYVSVPAISLDTCRGSVLAVHLAPLLLTYFPPTQGIVLAFSDPVLSARPSSGGINLALVPPLDANSPAQEDILARPADEYGVSWVWLTTTFLVFRPERGDELWGWTNVTSEGFVGLVSYNYFQTAVGETRIPAGWTWNGPSSKGTLAKRKQGKKGKLRDEGGVRQTPEAGQPDVQDGDEAAWSQLPVAENSGLFTDATGARIASTLKFRVVDTEVVPAHDRHKWSLQIEGTLLDDEAEHEFLRAEREKFDLAQQSRSGAYPLRARDQADVEMSGALRPSREGSTASRPSEMTPSRHRVAY